MFWNGKERPTGRASTRTDRNNDGNNHCQSQPRPSDNPPSLYKTTLTSLPVMAESFYPLSYPPPSRIFYPLSFPPPSPEWFVRRKMTNGRYLLSVVVSVSHHSQHKRGTKRRPRVSNGQRYPLPCCTYFGNLKCAQQGKGYCWPLLALGRLFQYQNLGRAADPKGTMSYRTEGWIFRSSVQTDVHSFGRSDARTFGRT